MPSAWGHTRLLETDWRFITQESHCFSCGSVKEGSMNTFLYLRVGAMAKKYSESLVKADKKEVRRSATLEAVSLMGSIVRENSGKVVKAFAKAAKGSAKKIFRGNRETE